MDDFDFSEDVDDLFPKDNNPLYLGEIRSFTLPHPILFPSDYQESLPPVSLLRMTPPLSSASSGTISSNTSSAVIINRVSKTQPYHNDHDTFMGESEALDLEFSSTIIPPVKTAVVKTFTEPSSNKGCQYAERTTRPVAMPPRMGRLSVDLRIPEDGCSFLSWTSKDSGYHTDRKRACRRKKACGACRKRKRRCDHLPDGHSPEEVLVKESHKGKKKKRVSSKSSKYRVDSNELLEVEPQSRAAAQAPVSSSYEELRKNEARTSLFGSGSSFSSVVPKEQLSIDERGLLLTRWDHDQKTWVDLNGRFCVSFTADDPESELYPIDQRLSPAGETVVDLVAQRSGPEVQGVSNFPNYPLANCGALSSRVDAESLKDKNPHEPKSRLPNGNSTAQSEDSPGNTTGSDDTELVEDDEELVIVLAKHRLLIKYMQEFYSMFGSSCGNLVECGQGDTPSTISKTTAKPEAPSQGQKSKTKTQKRKARDRESAGSEEDEEGSPKKRGKGGPSPDGDTSNRFYACPFHKFDPSKYSCTTATGSKYRTCAGPGSHNIARLKQHLKRVHSQPQFQCLRCWQMFPDHSALAAHLQEEIRCPKLDQPQNEGIPQQRWDMIKSRWGATWSNIFEIIFPGAPIPSSYYEIEGEIDLLGPLTPSSQEAADYEAYQRTELPRLVEAMLEAMIQARTDPLEERYKPFLLEIVRGAQSSLNQRWEMRKAQASPSRASNTTIQAMVDHNVPSDPQRSLNAAVGLPSTETITSLVPPTYEIPPPLGGFAEVASLDLLQETQNLAPGAPQFGYSDSGYGSQMSERWCQCGPFIDLSFGEPQDNVGYLSSSYSDPQTILFQNQQGLAERPGSLDSGSTSGSPQEKTVIKCTFCGNWRFK